MLKFAPLILALVYGVVLYVMSARRTRAALDAQSHPLDEPALAPVLDRLAAALELPAIGVSVYDIPAVNGLAAPDGRIFLTKGFLNRLHQGAVTADELASVVAHELGHVALGHTRRRMIDFAGQNAVATALVFVLARVLPGIGPLVANLLTSLVAARLSRADEFAADAWASALLIKAGIGTGPQISLFQKLDRLTATGGARPPEWLMSHPTTDRRIAAISANVAKWGAGA